MTDRGAPRDVRMHGFSQRAEVGAVLKWIDEHAKPMGRTIVALEESVGRVSAEPLTASIDVSAFDRSAMDGYAFRGAETSGASDYSPLAFSVIGQALPGRPFEDAVAAGSAVRVMTGAPIPAGTDAVRSG